MGKDKKYIALSILGIVAMIAIVSGVTYAWFSANIEGDGAQLTVTTAKLGPLVYTGTELTADGALPGWVSNDFELKVEGEVTGSEAVKYYCNITNTGEVSDIEYRVGADGASSSEGGTWKSIEENPIVTGSISSANAEDIYKIAIRFAETGEDQNDQQGKELSVKINCEVGETGSGDFNIVAWTLNGATQTGSFPTVDSGYTATGATCTNADATWNNDTWSMSIGDITGTPVNCVVNFVTE